MEQTIAEDKQCIASNSCPVCGKHFSVGKHPYRTMQQHIYRVKDSQHALWRDQYWKHHFTKGGYRVPMKVKTREEVAALVLRYYGITF